MTVTQPIQAPTIIAAGTPAQLAKRKQEGLKLVMPLTEAVQALTVADASGYQEADALLARVRTARKTWADKMEPIIRPIRQGLDNLYALNREVDKPLAQLEEMVKDEMKRFKLEEARQLRAADEEREKEQARIQAEIDAKAKAELSAKTKPMKERLAAARQALETKLEDTLLTPVQQPVRADSSSTRPVKKWRIKDLEAFVAGVVEGTVPLVYIHVNEVGMNRLFKDFPDSVKAMPGVEVYDDVQIVGR